MKYFVDILKQFTPAQRLFVLVLLLTFTAGSLLLSQYLKTDDCRPIIEENLKMQDDFAKISELLREERLRDNAIQLDSVVISKDQTPSTMDQVFKIAESYKK